MKKLAYILALAFCCSCGKDTGTVLYRINFTTNEIAVKSTDEPPGELYTQFGDYITSLTPTKFTACIWTTGYIDGVFSHSNNNANMLQYVEQNSDKLPFDDPSRLVDFSNNNVVSFNPVIYGRVNNDGQFEDQQINFIYFYFMPSYLYQEMQLPAQYHNVELAMFPNGSISDDVLKVKHVEMLHKIFPDANLNSGINLFFGNTDSTFIVNPNGEAVATSEDNPISDQTHGLVIRSHNYANMIFNSPPSGETVIMNGILSFNTTDLIQVYAGSDNLPYTGDDIFVYAPRFWERIYSSLEVN
jgi:hypothetical protein